MTASAATVTMPLGIDDVRAAAQALEGFVHRTPVLTSRTLDTRAGHPVFLKAENLQRGGSFKLRGALNKLRSISAEERAAGVVAYSSGNHAGAVALAARELGSRAVVVMPHDAPPAKRAAAEGYAADVVGYDRHTDSREVIAASLVRERGLTLIPPFDDPMVMAGQGTVALEALDQAGEVDTLVVPVGGGGLIAGCATVVGALSPTTTLIGVEPETGDDHRRSMQTGTRQRVPLPDTIADGLQSPTPGVLTWEVNRRVVDEFVTVSDIELVAAMVFAMEQLKLVLEPSGAAGLAAVLAGVGRGRTGVVLSGGNIDAAQFAEMVSGHGRP